MEDITVLLVGTNAELLRSWSWALVDGGALVGHVAYDRIADARNSSRRAGAIVVEALQDSKRQLERDIATIREWAGDAKIVVASNDAEADAIPSVTRVAPPVSGTRLLGALRESCTLVAANAAPAPLDAALVEVLEAGERSLSRQMRVVTTMCALGLSDKEMSDVLGVSPRTARDYAEISRERLQWRSRNDVLRHLAAALGWGLTPLLARVLGEGELANRIAAVVERVPAELTGRR